MATFPKTTFALFKNATLSTIITYFHVYSERAVSSKTHHDLRFLHFRSTLSEVLVADVRSSSTLHYSLSWHSICFLSWCFNSLCLFHWSVCWLNFLSSTPSPNQLWAPLHVGRQICLNQLRALHTLWPALSEQWGIHQYIIWIILKALFMYVNWPQS